MMCTDFGEAVPYDGSDYAVAAVFLTLLMLNVLGTAYDLCFHNIHKCFVSRLLLCFSVRRSWQKLVMPSGEGPDPKLRSLKCLNGIKAMTTLLVIVGHSPLTGYVALDNPQHLEELYHNPIVQFLMNGTLIVQTFFVISGFLLAYNILVASEKRRVGWQALPQGIISRWLRLTPVYAVVMAFITTWLRHLSSGPMWKPMVNIEVVDCRRYWWLHLLYVANYMESSQCMPQTWYISGDMQLSIVGLAIFCLCRSTRARKIAVAVAFVVGLLTPAAHTFFQNLPGVFIMSPNIVPNFLVEDPTFNKLYKRGHTNLVGYAMGLALGMVMYDAYGQEHTKNKKTRRMLYWAAILMTFGFVWMGMVFYVDGIQIPLIVSAVYSSVIKMCFGACVCGLIAGTLMKLDSVARGILEWEGWAPLGRISYCVYLIHMSVIRTSTAHFTALQHSSSYRIMFSYFGVVGVTYMLAASCWLLVESPVAQFIKLCLEGGGRSKSDITLKAVPPKWKDQELCSSVETVVVNTTK